MTTKYIGAKYEKDRDLVEIAKRIRQDLAEAVKAGALPAMKTTVRISRYSMGQSLSITVTELPEDFIVANEARVRQDLTAARHLPSSALETLCTAEANALCAKIEAIANAYNYDKSDYVADYHDSEFHLHVGIWHEIRHRQAAAIEAKVAREQQSALQEEIEARVEAMAASDDIPAPARRDAALDDIVNLTADDHGAYTQPEKDSWTAIQRAARRARREEFPVTEAPKASGSPTTVQDSRVTNVLPSNQQQAMANLPLPELLKAVAELLGGYTYEPPEGGEEKRLGFLNGPDGARIFASTTWASKGRLYLCGQLDTSDVGKTDITVADTTTPQRVAAEIKRRILPVYLPALRTRGHEKRSKALRLEARQRVIGEFAERVGDPNNKPSDRDGQAHLLHTGDNGIRYDIKVTIAADDDGQHDDDQLAEEQFEVDLGLGGLSVDQAHALLGFLEDLLSPSRPTSA